jgi:hypothetical protein
MFLALLAAYEPCLKASTLHPRSTPFVYLFELHSIEILDPLIRVTLSICNGITSPGR